MSDKDTKSLDEIKQQIADLMEQVKQKEEEMASSDSAETESISEDGAVEADIKTEETVDDSQTSEQDEPAPELLGSYQIDYNRAEADRYQRFKNGPAITKGTIIISGIIVIIAIFFLIMGTGFLPCLFIILMAGAFVGMSLLRDYIRRWRYFKDTSRMWRGLVDIQIYDSYILTDSHSEKYNDEAIYYDAFYAIEENDERMYLIANRRNMIIIDKSKISSSLVKDIRDVVKFAIENN